MRSTPHQVTLKQYAFHRAGQVRAFTLLETLVAVAVLLMALLGPFAIAQQSLRSAYYARDQVTAFYLAQEGVEFVRAVRDENYLRGTPWLQGIEEACTQTDCTVDFTTFTYAPCVTACEPLRVSQIGKLFNHATGDQSPFTRTVRITADAENPDERIITVRVSWRSSGVSREFILEERILDWL
ncbi:hypothetical protein KGO06_01635 [Patescibacteria group bacterium]|nr:hypothetical protein [Patescibacteria group bacterium]